MNEFSRVNWGWWGWWWWPWYYTVCVPGWELNPLHYYSRWKSIICSLLWRVSCLIMWLWTYLECLITYHSHVNPEGNVPTQITGLMLLVCYHVVHPLSIISWSMHFYLEAMLWQVGLLTPYYPLSINSCWGTLRGLTVGLCDIQTHLSGINQVWIFDFTVVLQ